MDVDLLERTLTERGEPAYRPRLERDVVVGGEEGKVNLRHVRLFLFLRRASLDVL
jgi:hypothetical protein